MQYAGECQGVGSYFKFDAKRNLSEQGTYATLPIPSLVWQWGIETRRKASLNFIMKYLKAFFSGSGEWK